MASIVLAVLCVIAALGLLTLTVLAGTDTPGVVPDLIDHTPLTCRCTDRTPL